MEKKGKIKTKIDCLDFKNDPDEFIKRSKIKAEKDKSRRIYASDAVKSTLLFIHHNKCCYCERKFTEEEDDAILAVEHFRPKGAVKQNRADPDEPPGYFWLAYKWDNLFLACHKCNSTWKDTLFPLYPFSIRARTKADKISLEKPLFVHPQRNNPRRHITFVGAVPKHTSELGRVTIKEIGLDRSTLSNARQDKIIRFKELQRIIRKAGDYPADLELQDIANEARAELEAAKLPDAEFSSMAIDYLGT